MWGRRGASVVAAMVTVSFCASGAAAAGPPSPSPLSVPAPGAARPPAPPDPVTAARAALADDPVASGDSELASIRTELGRVQARLYSLQTTIEDDQRRLRSLSDELRHDEAELMVWMRDRYKQGDQTDLLGYVVSGDGLRGMFERRQALSSFVRRGMNATAAVRDEHAQAARIAAASIRRLAELEIIRHRAQTFKVLAASETERLAIVTAGAGPTSDASLAQLMASYRSLLATAAVDRRNHTIYGPQGGSGFTIHTDLTQPSGETAGSLDAFLAGTALRGLGGAYMAAEHSYHVSARYLVAHSILESAWGRSVLAQDKHNLFGFGADDAQPYEHAKSFDSFAACIDFVARSVAINYLAPDGTSYAGPTLRGMNVHYASDPFWSRKIARLANTIP